MGSFRLPPAVIEINELGGRKVDGVQQVCDQPPLLGADGAIGRGGGEGRLDHAHRQQYPGLPGAGDGPGKRLAGRTRASGVRAAVSLNYTVRYERCSNSARRTKYTPTRVPNVGELPDPQPGDG